jgi:transcriptional regulator with PAS, ATPase and Fis domain
MSGDLPADLNLSEIKAREFRHDDSPTSHSVLIDRGRGGPRLLAILDGSFSRPDIAWRQDFLDYLRSRLGDQTKEIAFEITPPSAPGIVPPPHMLVGDSPAVQSLLAEVHAIARSTLEVLLEGETGTGKELYARLIHASGPNPTGPFVALNCAAIPRDLLESQLFGVARGAFTGAEPKAGLIREADGGTLFLDEIGDLPPSLQPKLLRVLQEREILPVGGSRARKVTMRVIAATNRDLARLVESGDYRSDLYYRLNACHLRLPTLAEQRADLPRFIFTLLERAATQLGKRIRGISSKALYALLAHPWRGNFRELAHTLDRAVLLCRHGDAIESRHLPLLPTASHDPASIRGTPDSESRDSTALLRHQRSEAENKLIEEALAATEGNKSRAAKLLGISRSTLYAKLRRI